MDNSCILYSIFLILQSIKSIHILPSLCLKVRISCTFNVEPLTTFTSLRSVRFLLHRAMPSYRLVLLTLRRQIRQSLPPYCYVSSCPDTQSFLQDVDRSVNITVMMTPTIWAIPFPNI